MMKFANVAAPVLVQVMIFGTLLAVWSSPKPPPGADFMYSVGWYLSHAFASVGNIFR